MSRLGIVASHVTGGESPPAPVADNYANRWTLDAGKVGVMPPNWTSAQAVASPLDGSVAHLAVDDNGYVWISDGAQLLRLDPRGGHYGPPVRPSPRPPHPTDPPNATPHLASRTPLLRPC